METLLTPYSINKYLPETNYYEYINNVWLEKTNLSKDQEYLTQIDNFRIVQEHVYRQVQSIILDYIKNKREVKYVSEIKRIYNN